MNKKELKICAKKYDRKRCGKCGRKLYKNILLWDDKKQVLFCKKCKIGFLPDDYYLEKDFVLQEDLK